MKLPICRGKRGYEGDYDCDYPNAPTCEECLVTYHVLGGVINPKTGKRLPLFLLRILYGIRYRNQQEEKKC